MIAEPPHILVGVVVYLNPLPVHGTYVPQLTPTVQCTRTVVLHTHCGREGNKLKRRWEWEREARHYQSEYKKKKKQG